MIASEELRRIHPGLELRYGWKSRRGQLHTSFRWSCCGLPLHSRDCRPTEGAHPGELRGTGSRSGGGGGGPAGYNKLPPPARWSCCSRSAGEPGCISSGQCACGGVRFDVLKQPGARFECGCEACRKSQRGQWVRWVPEGVIQVTDAEALQWKVMSGAIRWGSCSDCGMTLFWENDNALVLVPEATFIPRADIKFNSLLSSTSAACKFLRPGPGEAELGLKYLIPHDP